MQRYDLYYYLCKLFPAFLCIIILLYINILFRYIEYRELTFYISRISRISFKD